MKERSLQKSIQDTIDQLRWQLTSKVMGWPTLSPNADEIVAVLESAASLMQNAMNQKPVEPLLRNFLAKFERVLDLHVQIVESSEVRMLDLEHQAIEARRDAQAAYDNLERSSSTRQTIEEIREGEGKILASCITFAKGTVEELDRLLIEAGQIESLAVRITQEAKTFIPDVQKDILDMDNRIAALSARTAPMLVREYELSSDDLTEVDNLLKEQEKLRSEFGEVQGLMAALVRDKQEMQSGFEDWQKRWSEVREKIKSAALIFPLVIGRDLFLLAGTTAQEVEEKRRVCGAKLTSLHPVISEARRNVDERAQSIETVAQRMDERLRELDELRERLTLPEYDRLPAEDQELISSLVLGFITPNNELSVLKLAGIIRLRFPERTVEDEKIASLLTKWSFFVRRRDARFKRFGLTARGQYWLKRWQRDAAAAAAVFEARARFEQEEQSRAEAEEAEKLRRVAERAAQAEARRRQREAEQQERDLAEARQREEDSDPLRIREQLKATDCEVLRCLRLLPDLPGPRDAAVWSKIFAAALEAGLLSQDRPDWLANALVRLLTHDPSLFKASRNSQERPCLVLSACGEATARILSLPTEESLNRFSELLGKDSAWPDKIKESRRQLMNALVHAFKSLPDGCYRT